MAPPIGFSSQAERYSSRPIELSRSMTRSCPASFKTVARGLLNDRPIQPARASKISPPCEYFQPLILTRPRPGGARPSAYKLDHSQAQITNRDLESLYDERTRYPCGTARYL